MAYTAEIKITTHCYNIDQMKDIAHAILEPEIAAADVRHFCPLISQSEDEADVILTDEIIWHPNEDMPEDLAEFLQALDENNIFWSMRVEGEAEGDVRIIITTQAEAVC